MPNNDECRIYVACLASYNNGRLHGAWIDCDGKDAAEISAEINAMLATSPYPNVIRRKCEDCGAYFDISGERGDISECPDCESCNVSAKFDSAEEFAIHDSEGFYGIVKESTSIDDVASLSEILMGCDDDRRIGLLWLIDDVGYTIRDAIEKCDDVRAYSSNAFDILTDYAESFVSDCYSESELGVLSSYIDYSKLARDMLLGGDIAEFDGPDGSVIITNANEF